MKELINSIFIYPTDTIYGIGCNAEDINLVNKIREIKQRDNKPFSIIVPNIQYILDNCEVDKETKELIDKFLPGPYTFILKKKDKKFLKHVSDTEYIGIRIPKHPLTLTLQGFNKPIITTSVNVSGQPPIDNINQIPKQISDKVDFIIDDGILSGKPSIIIKEGKIIKR